MTVLNRDTEVRAKVKSSEPTSSVSTASSMKNRVTRMVVTSRRLIFSFLEMNSAGGRRIAEKTKPSKKGIKSGITYLNPAKMRPNMTAT